MHKLYLTKAVGGGGNREALTVKTPKGGGGR